VSVPGPEGAQRFGVRTQPPGPPYPGRTPPRSHHGRFSRWHQTDACDGSASWRRPGRRA
jgi:hypothetical protein